MKAIQYAILAEAHVTWRDRTWPITIEAQGDHHLRVCLQSDGSAFLPDMPVGTQLDLTMAGKDREYYAETTVLK
ncbi:MAG TPA: hypothetical protein VNJ09_08165, partial [Chthonomonadales bacterium]|nr:hypothetical protein [Chthonomonadales bacterium]